MWNKLRFKEKSVKSPPLRKFTLHFLTYVFSERDFLQVVTHSTSNDKQRLKESKGFVRRKGFAFLYKYFTEIRNTYANE